MGLFTIAEARAFDKGQLSDASTFTDAAIQAEHDRIQEMFIQICGVAFEPTSAVQVLDGGPHHWNWGALYLENIPVISISQIETRSGSTWTTYDADDLADVTNVSRLDIGELRREFRGWWPCGRQNVRVTYRYGLSSVPLEIHKAALMVVVDAAAGLVPSNLPTRAMSLTDELGTYRFTTPGIGSSRTGIPIVDETLERFRNTYKRLRVA